MSLNRYELPNNIILFTFSINLNGNIDNKKQYIFFSYCDKDLNAFFLSVSFFILSEIHLKYHPGNNTLIYWQQGEIWH